MSDRVVNRLRGLVAGLFLAGLCLSLSASRVEAHDASGVCFFCAGPAEGVEQNENLAPLRLDNRWSGNLNAAGFTGDRGDPITLTYGIVPDGTSISGGVGEPASNSNLVAFLNTEFGSSATWLPLIQQSYGRWAQLSGLTMVYEANDDGSAMTNFTTSPAGVNGVRADMRIGGHPIDGAGGTLAYNYYPSHGDQVLDTNDGNNFDGTANNYRYFRNVLMHEAGHGIGIRHFVSDNSSGLMEPSINTNFDGPQHDDILSAQRYYGDALEKNGGNDTTGTATNLGTINPTQSQVGLAVGTDANDDTAVVAATETDFISIDGTSDIDVFKFTLAGLAGYDVDLLLEPKGPTYREAAQGGTQTTLNTKALTNLQLELLNSLGQILFTADAFGPGFGEMISTVLAPGDYFARVSTGASAVDNVQMYRLDVLAVSIPEPVSLGLLMVALGAASLRRRR